MLFRSNQAKLAKEYGVDGFCFYHYWFEGEMLLHKPAELLLEHSEIDMPFCFMWANETWRSTWYCDRDEYHVLKMQTYGDEEEWKMHFNYLLPFLKDPRYICKEGKPIITLYHWNEIPRVLAMIEMWNELAKENGLPGIYFIQEETGQEYIGVEKDNPKTVFGPTISFKKGFGDDKIRFSNIIGNKMSCLLRNKFLNFLLLETRHYIKITKLMYRHAKKKTKDNYYLCAVAGWDNTPRKQKGGRILLGCTPSRFKRHLKDLLALSYRYQKEFLFIFAWNEWAEIGRAHV